MRLYCFPLACALLAGLPASSAPEVWVQPAPFLLPALTAAGDGAPPIPSHGAWSSDDGKSVAFFTRESSSTEGMTRALVVKDADSDAVIFEKVLVSEEEGLQRSGADLERLARSRAWEAQLFLEQHAWHPLLYRDNPHEDREFSSDACFSKQLHPKRSVSLDPWKVTYEEPRLQVWSNNKKILDRRAPSWRVRQQGGCEHPNPSWLKGLFVSKTPAVALLELDFCGVDVCNEPPAAFHTLRLPEESRAGKSAAPTPAPTPSKGPFIGISQEGKAQDSLYAAGFPAISADGTRVVLAEVFADEVHTAPNLLLTVRQPPGDAPLWSLPVLEATESASASKSLPLSQTLDKKVRERMGQAREFLEQTPWVPLKEWPIHPLVTEPCQQAPGQKVELKHGELTFQQGHLTLKTEGAQSPRQWTLAPPGEGACRSASRTFLDAAFVDEDRGIAVLRLSACGGESCPRPERWYRTLSLRSP